MHVFERRHYDTTPKSKPLASACVSPQCRNTKNTRAASSVAPPDVQGRDARPNKAVIRAVLDANVYVSAAVRPEGHPGQIIERFLRGPAFEIVMSQAIVDEVLRALSYPKVRKYIGPGMDPELWFEDIVVLSHLVPGERDFAGVSKDRDDDKYIAAAVEGRAGFVVAGDSDLLNVKEYDGIRVVSPRAFLDLLGRST